jgi:hypothetical protein
MTAVFIINKKYHCMGDSATKISNTPSSGSKGD